MEIKIKVKTSKFCINLKSFTKSKVTLRVKSSHYLFSKLKPRKKKRKLGNG